MATQFFYVGKNSVVTVDPWSMASEIKYSNYFLNNQTKFRKIFGRKFHKNHKMLNYTKIERLRNEKKIPKMEFYRLIQMTDSGYKKMLESNSMKVSTLEKIAEILGVRPTDFFSEEEQTKSDNFQKKYIELLEKHTQLQAEFAEILKNQSYQEPHRKAGNGA